MSSNGTSFVTVVHGTMRPVDGGVGVRIAAGGHPPPLLRRRDGSVEEVPAHGPIIGMLPDVRFHPADVLLVAGETLLCFTDGLPDARGPTGFLGVDRLAALLADCTGMTAQAIAERCLQTALEHLDGRPHDDMAVMAVQVDPAG
ncbi:MAG TPA: PP2C family protein-serine/threonine phosphatase [Acidimicrobiales bacterium]|nr:PP2C family protein-serine/threonine phosphatase [Acidimicrobiales bacterium]